jgi:hypothetical protein
MNDALGRQPRRDRHGHEHLHGEDDRRDPGGGNALQRRHLGQQAQAGGDARRRQPQQGGDRVPAVQRVDHELRRQSAPRERAPRGDGDQPSTAHDERDDGRERERTEHDRELRTAAGLVRRLPRDGGEDRDAREDDDGRDDLAGADGLAEDPGADDEQRQQPEGQRRLHHREGREGQRERLQRPSEEIEPRPGQPARTAREPQQQRRAQPLGGRRIARIERLEREPDVVEQGRGAGQERADED